jgi:AT hook motif
MKPTPKYIEGPEAAERFHSAMRKALTVSHDEIKRRVDADNRAHPRKRGRPPKSKLQGL